ncbi:hypothetical protein O181_120826 [Austropuccinia psidii MF-1]|uniref:Uncharacterized protein n=1 Tax=Austropuccinia psidii MF-1 TaxID=1389203 RepID=A0A9Q3KJ65_9BASI|nr:hypothetical protein [Austropuccinia psidii MF-1]
MPFKYPTIIKKGWNPNRQFKILQERGARIRDNQGSIQDIEEQLNQKEHTLIPSGSQGLNQQDSSVASQYSSTRKSVAKSHHYSQSQVVFIIIQGSNGKKKTFFQPEEERVRPNDPEAFERSERST